MPLSSLFTDYSSGIHRVFIQNQLNEIILKPSLKGELWSAWKVTCGNYERNPRLVINQNRHWIPYQVIKFEFQWFAMRIRLINLILFSINRILTRYLQSHINAMVPGAINVYQKNYYLTHTFQGEPSHWKNIYKRLFNSKIILIIFIIIKNRSLNCRQLITLNDHYGRQLFCSPILPLADRCRWLHYRWTVAALK